MYQSQGQYEQALPLYEQAIEILVKVLGEEHPNTKKGKQNYQRCLAAVEQD